MNYSISLLKVIVLMIILLFMCFVVYKLLAYIVLAKQRCLHESSGAHTIQVDFHEPDSQELAELDPELRSFNLKF